MNWQEIAQAATLGLTAWTLIGVHRLLVRTSVHAEQLEEHARRLQKLESRAGL